MSEVTIIFMSPRLQDFPVTAPLQISILDLKTKIALEHPQQPPVHSQRILFSGRLLRDNEILGEVFNPSLVRLFPIFNIFLKLPAQSFFTSKIPTCYYTTTNPTIQSFASKCEPKSTTKHES